MHPVENSLKQAGYQILGKQPKEGIIIRVDGKEHLGSLSADYTARKDGKSYVVVVKKGEGDFDAADPALRRRLIEYDRAFGLNGVLLIDPEEGEIHKIGFKFPRERNFDFYLQFAAALFIISAVIGIIWLLARVRLL
ncbi:hypothetical protein HZB08_02795 [Candidatus Saganbacteria bacterium]|uniref:Uncharacterized protein n=1 Tax=Candidatus Saganbacteria bacterium TaxID=2575572 RepID=A0A9D6UMH3_UNCSA|nr:hypothetical protein [Candidatus Saganbacteria bacterium]